MLKQRLALGEQWFSVAQVLVRNGEVALALSAAQRGLEECGGSGKARLQLAHVMSLVGRHNEAIALASEIPAGQVNAAERDHFARKGRSKAFWLRGRVRGLPGCRSLRCLR